jgi:hypothetical protein
MCEVNVGRASVRGAGAIATFLSKVFTYEKTPPATDYAESVVYFGMDISEPGDVYGEISKEHIRNLHLPAGWALDTEYDSEAGTHKADIIAYLDWGHHLVNHHDHCNTYSMGAGWTCHSEVLAIADVNALINGDRLSIVFAIGCWPADFPATTSIGEAFMRNANGGAVAFMGNTRYGWGGALPNQDKYSNKQDRLFYRNLFDDGIARLGENFSDLKNDVFEPGDPYNLQEYSFTQLHLLGDPGLTVWTEEPQALTVTHGAALYAGNYTTFPVEVSAGGSPVNQTTVCLWKDGDVYESEQTDSSGTATFGFTPADPGDMLVTVTGYNYLPYEGTAAVVAPTCQAQAARSCQVHEGAGRLCLEMGVVNAIEPRIGGISEVEFDLDDASDFAGGVTVTCLNAGDVSADVAGVSVIGNVVTVTFDPALPDEDACTMSLDCGASVCLRGLEGDLNRSGSTTAADALTTKIRFGQIADAANAEYDFNCSGEITAADYLQIKPRFGNSTPACP